MRKAEIAQEFRIKSKKTSLKVWKSTIPNFKIGAVLLGVRLGFHARKTNWKGPAYQTVLNLHWRNNFISRSIDACPSGASEPASDQCSKCPPGFICRPGEYPFPCPLGQYLNVSFNENGRVNWEGAEYDFFWDYECVDCPAGHKCGFAASEPFPCKSKSYNSHTGQMTCQECIPEFGEECSNAATSIKGLGSNNLNLLQKYWKDSI